MFKCGRRTPQLVRGRDRASVGGRTRRAPRSVAGFVPAAFASSAGVCGARRVGDWACAPAQDSSAVAVARPGWQHRRGGMWPLFSGYYASLDMCLGGRSGKRVLDERRRHRCIAVAKIHAQRRADAEHLRPKGWTDLAHDTVWWRSTCANCMRAVTANASGTIAHMRATPPGGQHVMVDRAIAMPDLACG